MTRDEIRQVLKMAIECYPSMKGKIDAKATLDMWEMTFAEYEAKDVFKGVRYHINKSKYFPTPADIKEAIPKGAMLYDDVPAVPQIDAPKTSYIEDVSFLDNIIDLNLEPDEQCKHCPKRYSCFRP